MASDFEKPDKVHTLWENEVPEKMWPLEVRSLLWVGKKTEERLMAYGIRTIGDLAHLNPASLVRLVGSKFAAQLHDSANGNDNSPVETEVAEAKSYSAERTFPRDYSAPRDIDRKLFNVACIVAHRIRRDQFRATTVSMFIKYKDFSMQQKQTSLSQPTDITALILNEARRMHPDYRFHRTTLPDGTDSFEVTDGKNVIERHIVASKRKGADYSGNSEE